MHSNYRSDATPYIKDNTESFGDFRQDIIGGIICEQVILTARSGNQLDLVIDKEGVPTIGRVEHSPKGAVHISNHLPL
ncbi:hypothetical protein Pla110_10840 [Polystyrenella longa]|uniref:Uncharacterized protein n=1 Tax=Polystyrenella longa TaxID=2528007 RepID=A0A518CJH0_9PLAN|nr:hypothetical protein Pla110_10840 [Polystyrenella longa]